MARSGKKVRYAVIGLGHIAQGAVLPSFQHARKNSELVALISSDPTKLKKLGKRYGVDNLYSYEEFDQCMESEEVDALYIALPNSMHREYTERAASYGVHVLCEKPMAVTEEDCRSMIAATQDAGVKLMIAYRLHFEKANLSAIQTVQSGKLGEPRFFHSTFSMQVRDENNIRLSKALGGGTLYDIGIYCINAARYLFRDEPTEVFALTGNNGQRRFSDVDEMTSVILKFPNERLATFTSSFGAADSGYFEVVGTKGSICLDNAYDYADGKTLDTYRGENTKKQKYKKSDQFAPELIYFSDCVLNDIEPEPSGVEGLADVRIVEALYKSAETGRPLTLEPLKPEQRPSLSQEIRRPPVQKPETVHASGPRD